MSTKWEYVTVSILNSYGMNYRANGEKQAQWKDKPIHDMLNDMGRSGYELVAFDGENYIFKRERSGHTTNSLKPLSTSSLEEK